MIGLRSLLCATCAPMPIVMDSESLVTRHTVVCQIGQSLKHIDPRLEGKTRYMMIFIVGNFTLEEANAFALDTFDSVTVPIRDLYFEHPLKIHTMSFSSEIVPADVEHVVNTFSTVDFVDAYTFYLTRHMTEYYFHQAA